MALINIYESPDNPSHVYSPFYFALTSSASTQSNFKFFADLYHGEVNPNEFVNRFYFVPRDNGMGIFSPHKILESYVSSNLSASTYGFHTRLESQHTYQIDFGCSYKVNPTDTGSTIFTAVTSTSLLNVNNSIRQYADEIPLSERTFIGSTPSVCQLLTDWNPANRQRIRRNDFHTIGIYRMLSNTIAVQCFDSGFTQIGTTYITDGYDPAYDRYEIGVGPANLGNIISGSVHYYLVSVCLNDLDDERSEQYGFIIDDNCYKNSPVRISWKNKWGGEDFFSFNMETKKQFSRKNNEWQKHIGYGSLIGERGRTLLNVEVQERFTVSSDWINNQESELLTKCFASQEHWLIDEDGNKLPIILIDSINEPKNVENDFLFNAQATFEYAYPVNTQRT